MIVDAFQAAVEALGLRARREVRAVFIALSEGRISHEESIPVIAAIINRADAESVGLAELYVIRQLEELTGEPVTAVGVLPQDQTQRLEHAVTVALLDQPKVEKFTTDRVAELITNAGLDPDDWKLGPITKRVNNAIREIIDTPDSEGLDMGTFIEMVNENPKRDSSPDLSGLDDWDTDPLVWNAPGIGSEISGNRLERLARSEVFQNAQKAVHVAARGQQSRVESKGQYLGWVRHLDKNACQLCRWWNKENRVWPLSHGLAQHVGCSCQKRLVLVTTKPKPVRRRRK